MSATLTVKGLKAGVGEKEILHGIDLVINPGETHVFMGPNGAGKSTLGNAIMGHGDLDLLEETADKRAKAGLFMTFQNPIEVPGITVANFMRNAIEMRTGERVKLWNFRKKVKEIANILTIPEDYADRDLNVGFSGGEKKKAEILQLLILDPDLAILDETDSGLDVDAVRVVSKGSRRRRASLSSSSPITRPSSRHSMSLIPTSSSTARSSRAAAPNSSMRSSPKVSRSTSKPRRQNNREVARNGKRENVRRGRTARPL